MDHDCLFFSSSSAGDSNAVDILRKGSASKYTFLHLYLQQSYASNHCLFFPPFLLLSLLPSCPPSFIPSASIPFSPSLFSLPFSLRTPHPPLPSQFNHALPCLTSPCISPFLSLYGYAHICICYASSLLAVHAGTSCFHGSPC